MAKYQDEEWLRERYEEDGLTQAEIGERCGVHRKTIGRWMEKLGIDTGRMVGEDYEPPGVEDLEEAQLAYIAGLIDADGSVSVVENNGGTVYSVKVQIYNRDGDTLRLVNGWLNETGTIHHRTRSDPNQSAETQVVWNSEGATRDILEAIFPYLRIKRDHAENALSLLLLKQENSNHRYTDEERERMREHYERQRELNAFGD